MLVENLVTSAAERAGRRNPALAGAGVLDLFDVLVDDGEAARMGLAGKPQPDQFLEAARRLGVPPARTAVVKDAPAGVEAGCCGGFALDVGVDRASGPATGDRLLRHCADGRPTAHRSTSSCRTERSACKRARRVTSSFRTDGGAPRRGAVWPAEGTGQPLPAPGPQSDAGTG